MSATPVGPDLEAALHECQGRDGFGFMDLGRVLGLAGDLAQDPRASMLAGARGHVPVFVSTGGDGKGDVLSYTLRLPVAAFLGIGAIGQSMMGGPVN